MNLKEEMMIHTKNVVFRLFDTQIAMSDTTKDSK